MNDRLEKQLAFLRVCDQEKQIVRQTYLADGSRKENDAEHAWHLALMAMLLPEYANEPVDRFRVMCMVLIHDVVEIEAGDSYAYDYEAQSTAKERERQAAEHLFGLLPEDQRDEFRGLWEEFEAGDTAEARFAHVLDNLQPMLLTDAADGKSWKEHGVADANIYHRNLRTAESSSALWGYMKSVIEKNVRCGNLQHAETAEEKK